MGSTVSTLPQSNPRSEGHLDTRSYWKSPLSSFQIPWHHEQFLCIIFMATPNVDVDQCSEAAKRLVTPILTLRDSTSPRGSWSWFLKRCLESSWSHCKTCILPFRWYSCVFLLQQIQSQHLYFLTQVNQNYLSEHSLNGSEDTSWYTEHSGRKIPLDLAALVSLPFCGSSQKFSGHLSSMQPPEARKWDPRGLSPLVIPVLIYFYVMSVCQKCSHSELQR